MTRDEFNEKYQDFLEEGHYGLDIDIPELIKWLDDKFQLFINVENFSYSQIKEKFRYGRFYCEGLPKEEVQEVEDKITEFCKR
jgi:hypothetical protein